MAQKISIFISTYRRVGSEIMAESQVVSGGELVLESRRSG
jgi:hypothetical protein